MLPQLRLEVVEVPHPVPFVAVSKAVSRMLTAREYEESAASFEGQRRLIRAARRNWSKAEAREVSQSDTRTARLRLSTSLRAHFVPNPTGGSLLR